MNKFRLPILIYNGKITGLDRTKFDDNVALFDDCEAYLSVIKKGGIRTVEHNAYMWAHVYKNISDITGYHKSEVHETFKEMFLPQIKRIVINFETKEKEIVRERQSTTKLSGKQLHEYIKQVKQFAEENLDCTFDDQGLWCTENPEEIERYS